MSCVLRATGLDFQPNEFCAESPLAPCHIHRQGEPKFRTRPNGPKIQKGGLNVVVSEASFDEFETQVQDAISFLQTNFKEVQRLCTFPGVESVGLDFGIAWRDVVAPSLFGSVRPVSMCAPSQRRKIPAKWSRYRRAGEVIPASP